MEEWKEEKFQPLLTSSIWLSNYKNIKTKLHFPYWDNDKYTHLLTPTIFVIKTEYIIKNISIMEKYHLEGFITINVLRKNSDELINLIEYLIENKVDLVIDEKINPILNCLPSKLKTKYGIDIKKLKEKDKIHSEYQYRKML